MKIAINCAFYQPKGGGIKEYIHNLVNNFASLNPSNEIILYVLKDQLKFAKKNLPKSFKIKEIPYQSGSKFQRIKRSLLEQNFWRREEMIEKFQLFHSPFFHAPSFKHAKLLLTVHDLRLYRFPDTYEFFRYQFLKRKVKSSIKKADHIISISEFTKQEIIELCDVKADKVTVILEAINSDFFSKKPNYKIEGIPEELKTQPFILSVGHMEPRKNYVRLIEAFNLLKKDDRFKNLKLVIVGKKDHSFEDVLKLIDNNPDIYYLDFVSGDTLLWLYDAARLFVFPSYYEGFGFPPLEAAALGTPSAVSNVSSIPEVCGEGAFYFNPYDSEEMAKVIANALTDSQSRVKILKNASGRLSELSWKKNASETLALYDNLLSSQKS